MCDAWMLDFINEILAEAGVSSMPATNHLFTVDDKKGCKLSKDDAELFHHLVAKLLYLRMQARPDLQMAISFLTTRVAPVT